jgi:hypothetical protein
MLIELNVINFLKGAAREVGAAMARRIDKVIQTTIMVVITLCRWNKKC